MSGIGVILNPYSRANIKHPQRADQLGFIVGDKGSCHSTHDLEDVERLAHEFKERDIEILGISGGDGTNHVTLSMFIKAYGDKPLPQIAFLRGGTMNNLANVIGIKGTPERILSNLILKYHESKPFQTTEVDIMKINDKYGFVMGMGVMSTFVDDFVNTEEKPSHVRAALLLAKISLSAIFHTRYSTTLARRFDARITIDGKRVPFKNYSAILAGTVETIGFHFNPLYRARTETGKFHFVGMSATPRHILFNYPRAILGKPMRSDNVYDEVGKHLLIETDKPISSQIDGDPQDPTDRFEITMGPRLTCIVS